MSNSVDNLVVRLLGDATNFVAMTKAATSESDKMILAIERGTKAAIDEYTAMGIKVTKEIENVIRDMQTVELELQRQRDEGIITLEVYEHSTKALGKVIRDQGKEYQEIEAAKNKAAKEALLIIESQITAEEKHYTGLKKIYDLMKEGHLTPKQATTERDKLQVTYDKPANDAAEKAARESAKMAAAEAKQIQDEANKIAREAEQIRASLLSSEERAIEKIKEYGVYLKNGSLLQEDYNRAVARQQEILDKPALDAHNKLVKEGEDLTRRHMTAQEKFDEELENYTKLLEKGSISQETFGKGLGDSLRTLNSSETQVRSLSQTLEGYGRTMLYVGGAIAGIFALTIRQGVNAAAQYETTVASFKTMIGSLGETQSMMKKLSDFAVEAPMTMPQIEQAAMGLIQFGERGDAMIGTLKTLGNAAAGTGTNFNLLSSVFNQVRGVGHLLTGDFRQLSTRGVLSLRDIAKHFNVTEAAAGKMLSSGQISFGSFKAILDSLSKEGGRFHNMMEDQAKTLEGQMAKLNDAVNIAIRDLGQKFMPIIKMATGAANAILDGWKNVPDFFKTVIAGVMGLTFALGTGLTAIGGWVLAGPSILDFMERLRKNTLVARLEIEALAKAKGFLELLNTPLSQLGSTMSNTNRTVLTFSGLWKFLSPIIQSVTAALATVVGMVGVAAVAVGGVAWILFSDNLRNARREVDQMKESTKELTVGMEKSNVAATKKFAETKGNKRGDLAKDRIADANERSIMLTAQIKGQEDYLKTLQGDIADKFDMGGGELPQKILAKQRIEGLKEQLAQLGPITEQWQKELASFEESGVSTTLDEDNTQRNKDLDKQIRAAGVAPSDRLFDPAGERKDRQHLAEMRSLGFNDSRLDEAKQKQDKLRKERAAEEVREIISKAHVEKSLIGATNKELAVRKYTEEGLSKLHAEQLADTQFNLGLMKELNALQEQNRDLGKTPHQVRKAKAEREGADSEGMALVEGLRLEEEKLKQTQRLATIMGSVRAETESSLEATKKMVIQNALFTTTNDTWATQTQMRRDAEEELYRLAEAGNDVEKIAEIMQLKKIKLKEREVQLEAERLAKGKETIESLKSPAEKLREELKRIQEELGTTEEQKAEASARLVAQNIEGNPMSKTPENKSIAQGSSDFLKFMRDQRKKDIEKSEAKVQTEALLVGNGLAQQIIDRLGTMGVLAIAR